MLLSYIAKALRSRVMGSELQTKYQRLAQEYAKLRSHVDVLKKAVTEEKSLRESLQESVREKALSLRKHVQENESLEFRNQQLSKRVEMLQDDLGSPLSRRKKKVGGGAGGPNAVDGVVGTVSGDVQTQELAAKIAQNEQLHLKVSELAHESQKSAAALQTTRAKLESDMSSFSEEMEQKEREHKTEVEAMTNNRAMLEAKLAKYSSELKSLKNTLQREQELSGRLRESSPIGLVGSERQPETVRRETYAALNVPVVDAKLQGRVLVSLRASLELVTSFATQLSTLHSYLQQRCKTYPIDTSTGVQISTVNQKLCKLLHSSSSSYTKPLVSAFSQYSGKLHANPYSTPVSTSACIML
ncbi:Protein phosphatase 1 regulatory subunit 21 [Geodia barretti]|uniref:Protein phosphatase 1 regulatory subunit 21 n=1 Tax=Geodia barretti TaxID=519541 RepID=A0AA35SNS4_GEOBA|nr:Protein phosphatase 1 regulatory subunit 21 [Geodia barretti]